MQWGQIKTLFILCFLILDIFLLHHFINNPKTDYEYTEEFPREDDVRNNVNGLSNLPENPPAQEAMLYAERRELSAADLEEIAALPEQSSIVIEGNMIVSMFNDPLDLDLEENPEAVASYIWSFSEYEYFGKNEETNTHIFFQTIERPIYFNYSAVILVQENGQGELVNYLQTSLIKAEEQPEEEEINQPFDELSGLYFSGSYISSGDEITSEVQLGYHNLLPLPNGVQVLAPTWEFEINEKDYFYVNAIESHVTTRNTSEFIEEMRTTADQYFTDRSGADIEAVNDSWDREQVEDFIEDLINQFTELNGVE
ncbi:two-component system regulatory protein YycI [Gracilibacillus alcaliphilus]|uniref:two-component system regulatory protein YycI n=1 Tax=Gracilibacillus alcaliphilus TaxID=1401441 RepID=UPI0019591141|nr:two-component system regulatory protein YycI [Gracilibacillus alcaliphilus]MBM7678690.1 regulatory protein YycI of two-component signal transduction system YycFG [Gracilibacillus alcaliphilus]